MRPSNRKTPEVIVAGENDLSTRHPSAASWHPTKNTLSPNEIGMFHEEGVWWVCSLNHEWFNAPINEIMGGGCGVCGGWQVLEGFNDFLTTHPEHAADWHPTLNGELTPNQVTVSFYGQVWWLGNCGHPWKATPAFKSRGNVCPVSFSCT